MATMPVQLDEKAYAAEQIAALELPASVRFLRLEEYNDVFGEPSYFAYLAGPTGDFPTEQDRKDRMEARRQIQVLTHQLKLKFFTYIQFVAAGEP